jgi:hypothetical protein
MNKIIERIENKGRFLESSVRWSCGCYVSVALNMWEENRQPCPQHKNSCPSTEGWWDEEEPVQDAIEEIKELDPGYWEATLKQRILGPGSRVLNVSTTEDLEQILKDAEWEETSHPDVQEGCRLFTAPISGTLGVIELSNLPPDELVIMTDPKGTGYATPTLLWPEAPLVPFTCILLGPEKDREIVYTFHPGWPIRPSRCQLPHGTRITAKEAMALGLTHAKIA